MENKIKILGIASKGGHWLQLQRLKDAFGGCSVNYISTGNYKSEISDELFIVKDANQWNKFSLIIMALQVFFVIVYTNPDIIISTGAAPGFFGLFFGKVLRKKTIWVDSIANSEEMSLSGKKVKKFADLYLTQWSNVSGENGPYFKGAIL